MVLGWSANGPGIVTVKILEVAVLVRLTSVKYRKTAQSSGSVADPNLYDKTRGPRVAGVRAVCITRGGGMMYVPRVSITGDGADTLTNPGTLQGFHTRSKASSGYLHKKAKVGSLTATGGVPLGLLMNNVNKG